MKRPWKFAIVLSIAQAMATLLVASAQEQSEHFPPNPQVQWKHLRLDIRVPDMNDPAFEARATYTIAPAGQRVESIQLDAAGLEIRSVREGKGGGAPLEWSLEGNKLQIRLREPIGPAILVNPATESPGVAPLTIVIDYRVRDPEQGMTFSTAIPGVDGQPRVAAEIHTQGQPESNHFWFPVHDFPNIRLSTEIVVDLPAGVSASSNGRLVEHRTEGNREIWHWLQEKPHVPYLVSLVAGHFQRTELPSSLSGVPMTVWTRPSHAHLARATYANTDRMMACFGRVFGEPYPWVRYDQLVVRNFGAGGMENTSATTMHSGAVLDSTALLEGDIDGLISHELCHQWTGDLMTCKSWEHLWLNEGWATYGSALWMEERDGADGYYDSMLGSAAVAENDTGLGRGESATTAQAMCSRVYKSAGETFRRAANPYPKGASILHMLRRLLGDEIFFRGVGIYVDRFAGKTVETDDFRKCLEEASGRSLEEFFNQWCFRSGCPVVKVSSSYDAGSRLLTIDVEQKQRNPAASPMKFDLPVLIRTATGERTISIAIATDKVNRQEQLDGPPTMIAVDPTLDVLKVLEVSLATPLLIEQMRSGPTAATRRQAVLALRETELPQVRDALASVARDQTARMSLRVEAIEALSAWGSPEAREVTRSLFDELVVATLGKSAAVAAQFCHPRLRATLTEAIAVAPLEHALARLQSVLDQDSGYAPRIAAAEGLARLGAVDFPDQRALLVKDAAICAGLKKMLAVSTPNESVRSAALKAIRALGLVELRDQVAVLAMPGHVERMRPSAIEALAELAPSATDPSGRAQVVTVLAGFLDDPESRAQAAAGEALANMKATEALAQIDAMATSDPDPRTRERAEGWARKIRAEPKSEPKSEATPVPAPQPAAP